MIIVHAYCSYKLSTSGFQYGTFTITDHEGEETYFLSDENKDSIVSSAFDFGIVKRLKGRMPNKNSYIFLFKKLFYKYDSEHDDVGGDVSINMAFEFDDYTQFVHFFNGFEQNEIEAPSELARELADCIFPDITITKYKLSIRKKNMDAWLKRMIDNQQKDSPDEPRLKHQLGIITDSDVRNLYCNELQEIFSFDKTNENGDEVGIMHLDGAMYVYPVKKIKKDHKTVLKILAIALIGVFIAMIIILKNSHIHAMEMEQCSIVSDEGERDMPCCVIENREESDLNQLKIIVG